MIFGPVSLSSSNALAHSRTPPPPDDDDDDDDLLAVGRATIVETRHHRVNSQLVRRYVHVTSTLEDRLRDFDGTAARSAASHAQARTNTSLVTRLEPHALSVSRLEVERVIRRCPLDRMYSVQSGVGKG